MAALLAGSASAAAPTVCEPRLLLLTFARLAEELDVALLASPPAHCAAQVGRRREDLHSCECGGAASRITARHGVETLACGALR